MGKRSSAHGEKSRQRNTLQVSPSWSVTIGASHAYKLISFFAQSSKIISARHSWRGVLDLHCRRPAAAGRLRAGGGGQYRAWRRRDRPGHGGAGLADCVCAYLTISFAGRGEACGAIAAVGAREFPSWRARLFYVGRVGGDGNGDQAGPAVSSGKRTRVEISRGVATPELSREHAGRDDRQRQCGAAHAVCADASGVGGTWRRVSAITANSGWIARIAAWLARRIWIPFWRKTARGTSLRSFLSRSWAQRWELRRLPMDTRNASRKFAGRAESC